MTCGEPGLVPFTDDGEWHIANGDVVMVRLDGRMVTSRCEAAVPVVWRNGFTSQALK
jgi:hypothetical protein